MSEFALAFVDRLETAPLFAQILLALGVCCLVAAAIGLFQVKRKARR